MTIEDARYMTPIRLRNPLREASARSADYETAPQRNVRQAVSTLPVVAPHVEVPRAWREALPHKQFVTVLPYRDTQEFRHLLRTASVTQREDGNQDVIGVLRRGTRPVWLTAIWYSDPKRVQGMLDFGGMHRRADGVPNVLFTVLYGSPEKLPINMRSLMEDLEAQFAKNGLDPVLHRKTAQAWAPHLEPLAKVWQLMQDHAVAVVFTGLNKHRGALTELGLQTIPVLSTAAAKILDQVWPDVPYQVSAAGWFTRTPEISAE